MAFQPMLVIGCGGSGGATLQYMMDNLRAQLSRQLEKVDLPPLDTLPPAWQFVHVDVATVPDSAEANRPPSVQAQGGTFIGLANPGLTWRMVAEDVWARSHDQRPDLLAGWLRRPNERDPALPQGAGQERAVGRGVTLSSVKQLRAVLESAHSRMAAGGANSLRPLAAAFGGNIEISSEPLVFIVSSMAGGSGASMVLDVPLVLATIDPNLGKSTAMFLYTSEVFGYLPKASRRGVEANGLAMMGELLATSLGSNEADSELLRLLGVSGTRTDQPFRRIFPIGARAGTQGALFGDGSLESIYRAVGRALAGLTGSSVALAAFVSYDLVNPNPQQTELSWLGEGTSDPNSVLWGTFGYASLSLGRDRYGEYVAQLLARRAVDRLVAGHKRDDESTGDSDLQIAADAAYRNLLHGLGLSRDSGSVTRLLGRKSGGEAQIRQNLELEMKDRLVQLVFSDGEFARALVGNAYLRSLNRILSSTRTEVDTAIQEAAYAHVYRWHQRFVADVLDELTVVASRNGLAVARQVIDRLRRDVSQWAHQLIQEATAFNQQSWSPSIPEQLVSQLNAVKASVTGQMQNTVIERLSLHAAKTAAASAGRLLAKVLEDFTPSFANPLGVALADQEHALEQARVADPKPSGQSDLRVAAYAEWPRRDAIVPPRFEGAHNEVVLYDCKEFPAQFDRHVQAMMATRKVDHEQEAERIMVYEILRNRWPQREDEGSDLAVIVLTAPWTPPDLVRNPADPNQLAMRSSAQFMIKFGVGDVIQRARDWVWRKDGEFGAFLRVDLAKYLDPTKRDFTQRLGLLADRFDEALTQALPLVSVDTAALAKVHSEQLSVNYKFSAVPFFTNQTVRAKLDAEIRQRSNTSATSADALNQAMVQADGVDRIDVFASYAPMSPLVFGSLLKPLTVAWQEAVSSKDTTQFWRNRRARPLWGAIAMSPAERQASVAGYIVSKITGRIRGSYRQIPGRPVDPLEVYDASRERWLRFPDPLLTPFAEGYQKDEVAAILESQLLAIATCGADPSFGPLRPYVQMRHNYARVTEAVEETQAADIGGRTHERATGREYLTQWILYGWRPAGAPPATWAKNVDGKVVDLTTPEGRKEAAIGFLTSFREQYAGYFHPEDPRLNPGLRPFDRRPMIASLIGDFVWALDAVRDLVQEISLDGTSGSGEDLVLDEM